MVSCLRAWLTLTTFPLCAKQVLHELTCAGCGACSRVVEQYTHLSLELPAAQGGGAPPEASVAELLRDYFKVGVCAWTALL